MGVSLIKRVLMKDWAYAASDSDDPAGTALAVAYRGTNGWSVAAAGGREVGSNLDQRQAVALMLRTAAKPRSASTAQRVTVMPTDDRCPW